MIATPQMALEAAAAVARDAGMTPLHPRRRDRRRGARRRQGAWPASRARSRATASRSRRRACCCPAARPRSPCAASGRGGRNVEFLLALRDRAGRPARHPRARRRHRRRRRRGGNRRRHRRARHAGARRGAGHQGRGAPRRQRWPRLLRGARRLGRHRSDADQCQRLPRDPDQRPGPAKQPPTDKDHATPTQRQDRRYARARQLDAGRHPRPVRCRGRCVPPQLQPRHARRAPRSARADPRRSSASAAARSACWPTCRDRSCASARLPAGPIILAGRPAFRLDLDAAPGRRRARARCRIPRSSRRCAPGVELLLDDGKLRLRVESCGADFAETRWWPAAPLSDRKGVNVPGAVLPLSALTDKDRRDLDFGLELGVDWVALSFVQRPEDLDEVRALIGGRAAIMAKLEKPAAIEQLDEIVAALRRGDGGARRSRRGDAARAGADRSSGGSSAPAGARANR